jgi:ParB/RepB/Spo0J family partition protein
MRKKKMSVELIPLNRLQPPAANPRHVFDDKTIEGLAASIRQDGMLQSIVVRPSKGKTFRVVLGERRYRALRLLQEQGHIAEDCGVKAEVRAKLTKEDALRLATVENVQRENLPPLDEAKAFAAMIRKGETLEGLAAKTGLSTTTIRRRLVLNDLCREAKEALAAGTISLAQAEGLTLGDHDAQRSVLGEIEAGYGPYSAADIRDHLLDDRPCVAMAVFPLEQYTGTITTDLFAEGESSYFDDPEQFLQLQKQAVERLAAEHEAKAAWVAVTNTHRIPDWQYEQAEDGEPSGVLINLSPTGRVEIREGLARPEIDDDTRAATADNPAAPRRPKAAYAKPLCQYIGWHKTLAVQELLLADPRKARDVAVVERLTSLKLHQAVEQLARADEPGSAYAVVEGQARRFAGLLGFTIEDGEQVWSEFPPRGGDEVALYEAVSALRDHDLAELEVLLAALTFGQEFCERLDTADSLFNRVGRDLGADMRNHWRPDRVFFERRSREQLLAIAQECGCADVYSIGSLRTYKKKELVACLLRHFVGACAAQEPNAAQRKARE